ncbi:reverse transcriptase domain-containing protein [Tanacetum coccineum]
MGFHCRSCDFYLHTKCALLLPRMIIHKFNKHPLTLRYEPAENHISEYFCEICEEELNPTNWFYHCTTCDESMHTACVPIKHECEEAIHRKDMKGIFDFINVKFGGTYEIESHPHRVSFIQGTTYHGCCEECNEALKSKMMFKCLNHALCVLLLLALQEIGEQVTVFSPATFVAGEYALNDKKLSYVAPILVLKNSLEALKVLKNSLEVLNVLQSNLESMELQENSSIHEVGTAPPQITPPQIIRAPSSPPPPPPLPHNPPPSAPRPSDTRVKGFDFTAIASVAAEGYKTWVHHDEPALPPPLPVIDNTRQPQMSDMTTLLNDLNYIPPNNEHNEPTQGDIEAEVERLIAMPTPSPSPPISLSPPSAKKRLARCTALSAHSSPPPALIDAVTAELPSPPLPPSLHIPPPLYIPPPVDRRDDILESEQLPRKRLCLSTLGSRYKVGESSTARPTMSQGIDYRFVSTIDAQARRQGISEVGYGIRDTWLDPAEAVPEITPMTLGEVNTRVTELAELHEHDTQDLYALLEDAQEGRTCISQMTLQETVWIIEEEAYASREAWAHSIGLSQAVHHELQTHRDHVYAHETHIQAHQAHLQLQNTDRRRKPQMVKILRVMRDMRREMGDMQAELLALRGQQRARQPRPDARIPDHQDASRDADSHI